MNLKAFFPVIVLMLAGLTQAQEINLSGRVVDGGASPVEGATVALETAGLSTATDAQGMFVLNSSTALGEPAVWFSENFSLRQGAIHFKLDRVENGEVAVYNSKGGKVVELFAGVFPLGESRISLAPALKSVANGFYLVKANIGSNQISAKIFWEDGRVSLENGTEKIDANPLLRAAAGVDNLIISKAGLGEVLIDLESYVADLGDITLGSSSGTLGCGADDWPESGRHSINVGGSNREYVLNMPDDYDPTHNYPMVFGWHWRGGQANDVVNNGYYGLENRADGSMIFISPEGIDNGWANTQGRDIEFLEAMLDRFRSELCIDESRIFSTGFSYGGMMSLAVGCALGDVFRAIAPMSGAIYSGCEAGDAPVAFWGSHGDNDNIVPLSNGEGGLQEFLDRNNCSNETVPVDPSPCVSYQGCDDGYPVTWCEFSGGHSSPNFSGGAIWDFFSQF